MERVGKSTKYRISVLQQKHWKAGVIKGLDTWPGLFCHFAWDILSGIFQKVMWINPNHGYRHCTNSHVTTPSPGFGCGDKQYEGTEGTKVTKEPWWGDTALATG